MTPKSVQTLLKEKRVSQVPKGKVISASPEISIQKAIEIMQEERHGYIALVKNKKVVGIFTETDVSRQILGEAIDLNTPVSQVMAHNPITILENDCVGKAIALMGENRVYHLPVVDAEGRLEEVLSVRALIRFLAEFYPTEVYNLPPDPDQVMKTAEGG